MVLYKNKIKIKYDRVVKKGSSFVMFFKINPDNLDKVNIGTEKKAKEKRPWILWSIMRGWVIQVTS